jgi:hypothetical protein
MVLLQPTYIRKLKSAKPITKVIRVWDTEAVERVAGSFLCTDCSVFMDACPSIGEQTDTINCYINFCI